MDLFTLAAKLSLDSGDFNSGVKSAEASGKDLQKKLSGAFSKIATAAKAAISVVAIKKGIDAVTNLANATAQAGDKIDKQSQSLGMSRKAYQEWDYILSQSGSSIDSMGVSMKTLNNTLTNGGKSATNALKELGLSSKNLQKMSQEKAFEKTVQAFQKLPAGAKKSALAVKLFGRNGMELLPLLNSSSDSVDKLKKKAEELGLIMSDDAVDASVRYSDALDTAKRTAEGLKRQIGSRLLPVFTDAMQKMTSYAGKLSKVYQKDGFAGVFKTITKDIARGIKWPSWNDVKVYAKRAWESIKTGVSTLGGLIFGKNKKGQVKWPTWKDVKKAAESAWKTIKSEGQMLAARILGRFVPVTVTTNSETGESIINWPSWDQVSESAGKAWNDIKEKIANIADEFGGLVFGKTEDGKVAWPDPYNIGKSAHDWWVNEVLPQINSVIDWLIGVTGFADENGTDTLSMISGWWNDGIKPFLGGVLDFTLGLFGLPSVSQMAQKVSDWWNNDVVNTAKKMITSLIPVDTANRLLDESLRGALTRIDAKVSTAQGLLDTLTSLGDASKLSSEKQDEWRKTADALIALFPQLSAVIDTDKMSISQNTDEIKRNIEEWANLAKERAIQDAKTKKLENLTNANTSLLEKQIELETKRNELKTEQQKQIDGINKKLADYGITATVTADNVNEVYKKLTDTLGTSEEYDELWKAFAGGTTKVGALKTDIILLNAQIEANQKQLDAATADYKQWEAALSSLLSGTKSNVDTVGSALDSLAGKVNALPTTKTITINTVYKSSGSATDPTFKQPNVPQKFQQAAMNAKGNWDVPYDNYAALLHRNEMVLTASQARQYREGQNGMNLGALANTIAAAVKEGMKNAQVNAYMDGKEVTDNVSRRMANEFKAMRYAT